MRADGIVVRLQFSISTCASRIVVKISPFSSSSQLSVQALAIAVLPGTSRFDVERLDADPAKPFANVYRDKLRSIV